MSRDKLILGFHGEDEAVKFLKKNGYKIIDRNFRCHFGEVDIVARHKNFVVFIEVKTRNSVVYGLPRQAVDFRKQQTIIKCAKLYILKHNLVNEVIRFDVVEVLEEKPTLIQDAFRLQ